MIQTSRSGKREKNLKSGMAFERKTMFLDVENHPLSNRIGIQNEPKSNFYLPKSLAVLKFSM
jgi:hypothetical protein